MGLRELLILVLILAIVGVILRGLYVALRARRGQLRMALEKNIPNYDPDELSLSELPNGGARMVERSFAEVVRQNSEFSARDRARSRHNDSGIPVLMDSVDDEPAPERSSGVANARQAARKKHLLGTRQPLQQKPTHRPIDRMKARDAAAAAAASAAGYGQARDSGDEYSDEAQPATEYDEVLNPPPYEQETPVDRPQDYAEEIGDEFDDSFAARREPDLDEFDEDSPEQDFDDDEPDDFDERFDDDPADLDDDDFEENWDDDEDDEDEDEDEDDFEQDEMPGQIDEVSDDDWDEDDDVYEDDDDFAEDDYRQPRGNDDYVDPLDDVDLTDYDDDYGVAAQEQEVEQESRGWWKKVGSKLGFGGRSDDSDSSDAGAKTAGGRTEPVISDSSFDNLTDSAAVAAVGAAAGAVGASGHGRRRRRERDLVQQEELNLDTSEAPQYGHDERYADYEQPQQAAEQDLYDEPGYDDEAYEQSAYDQNSDLEDAYQDPAEPYYEEPQAQASAQGSSHAHAGQETDQSAMPDYNEVLVINVMAKQGREFAGVDVLQALLGTGLRFGEMSIFHRHLDGRPNTPVVFSVANMLNPGTFDLNQISDFSTRGVCFFMTLPNVVNSMQALELMLDVAQRVRIALDGDLKDDNRSVMTAQTIEHYRQRVRDFDLRQLRQKK